MDNAVKSYTDSQIINRVMFANGFKVIPSGYWFCFIRSAEDLPDVFDDKCYLFKGRKFIEVAGCTTNPGSKGLKDYRRYNKNGTFVAKSNQWNYNLWRYGLHRGKMPALKQVTKIFGFRDNNRNKQSEEIGREVYGLYGINFHSVDYTLRPNFWRRLIGGWSVGCFVINSVNKYLIMLNKVKTQGSISMVLLKEW